MVNDQGKKTISQKNYVLIVLGATLVMVTAWSEIRVDNLETALMIILGSLLTWLFLVWGVSVRRLRALGKPRRYGLLIAIPLVGIGLILYLALARDGKSQPLSLKTMTHKAYISVAVGSTLVFVILLVLNRQMNHLLVTRLFLLYSLVWRLVLLISASMRLAALQKKRALAVLVILPLADLGVFVYLVSAKGIEINRSYQLAPVYLVAKEQEHAVAGGQALFSDQTLQRLYEEKNRSLLVRKLP